MSRNEWSLVPFDFEDSQIRVFTDEQGDPWFVGADVCSVLGIGNPRQAMNRLDEDEKGVISTDTPGGEQSMTTIKEPGIYNLVLGSRKPAARGMKAKANYPAPRRLRATDPQPAWRMGAHRYRPAMGRGTAVLPRHSQRLPDSLEPRRC